MNLNQRFSFSCALVLVFPKLKKKMLMTLISDYGTVEM